VKRRATEAAEYEDFDEKNCGEERGLARLV